MKPKKLPKKEFDKIYSKVPRLTVEVIIKTKDGILLSKRSIEPFKGMWHMTGGTVRFSEKLESTALRVAYEETGLRVKFIKNLGILDYGFLVKGNMHVVAVCFLVKPVAGKLKGSYQGEELKYFKKLPQNTIKEQVKFLRENNLID